MATYILKFNGVQIGDELLSPRGGWRRLIPNKYTIIDDAVPDSSTSSSNTVLMLRPSFRVRVVRTTMWHFEQWIFDLAAWADGVPRPLQVYDNADTLLVDYGQASLLELDRPQPEHPSAARYSSGLVLTFQCAHVPDFYLA